MLSPAEISKIKNLEDALKVISILVAKIKTLKVEVARLKKDSSTSSKPPSSDIVKPLSQVSLSVTARKYP